MGDRKKFGFAKTLLYMIPFFILPALSLSLRIFENVFLASRLGGASASSAFSGGELRKTIYNIFFILAFICCLGISYLFKKHIAAAKLRAVRSLYITIFLIYNAILIPVLLYTA